MFQNKVGPDQVLTLGEIRFFAKWNEVEPRYGKLDQQDDPEGDFLFLKKTAGQRKQP